MTALHLPLKAEFFNAIKLGVKKVEYRLVTPYWAKRLAGKHFDTIVLTMGYPKATSTERRLTIPFQGWQIKTITHPHFGAKPVEVYAIDVSGEKT